MSISVPLSDVSLARADDAFGDEDDRKVMATIPITVPLPTWTPPPGPEAIHSEASLPEPVLPDAELLSVFVARRDPAAFTQIVQRYGPMVYRVALRAVQDRHLADDVYQATFLVLAQSARQIKHGEVLPAWLHGTAHNVARRALTNQHTERQRMAQIAQQTLAEKGGEMTPSTELDPFEELARLHEQQLLDEELQQLPEASRAPLVLFYLEEKSQAEIAQLMGLSVEAVEGRLRRAKQELRQRLIRRGVFLSTVVAAATVLTPSLATAAPASTLVSATLATALGTTAVGTSLIGGTATSTTLGTGATTAAKLAAQEVAAMSAASKATAILITTVASTTVATGLMFGAVAYSLSGGETSSLSAPQVANQSSPALDRFEIPSEGFLWESDEPILLAMGDPEETTETRKGESTHDAPPDNSVHAEPTAVVYQLADLNAGSLNWVRQFVEANSDSVSVHKPTRGLVVRATPESHMKISEMLTALRNQQIPAELQVDLDPVPGAGTKEVGDSPQDQAKAALPAPVKTGLIKTVSKDRTNRPKYVELTQGSNDGLTIGQLLHVARRDVASGKATLVGRTRVVSVQPDSAVAEVVSTPLKEIIEVGDTVSLQLPGDLEPAPELAQLINERDELIRLKEAEIAKWQQSYRTEQVEMEQIRDELARQSKELNERITRLNQIVDFQRQRLDELTPPMDCFPFADGKITTVDHATATVWLNVGRQNGLRTMVTFSVYSNPHKGLGRDPKDVKARIEVVELRETTSIARVVEEELDRPIMVGDEIFSPAWCEGLPEHFAVVGNGDLNNDGDMDAKDRQILKDLLKNSGATLDVEIADDGQRLPAAGKLTAQTKWLIIGDVGDPAAALNDPEKLKRFLAVQKQHEMLVQEAREHGIRIVSLKDFLTYLGWKPESRLYIPGPGVPLNLKPGGRAAAANPEAMPPPTEEQIETMFQTILERNPTPRELVAWQDSKFSLLEVRSRLLAHNQIFNQADRDMGKFIERIYQLELQISPTTEEAQTWLQRAGELQSDRVALAREMLQEFEQVSPSAQP